MTGYPAGPAAALFLAPADESGALAAMPASLAMAGGVRIGERIGGPVPKPNPEGGAPLALLPCPFAALVLAQGPAETTVPALRALFDRVAAHVDRAASVLIVGTEYIVKPGDGAVLVTMLVRRRIEFTPASFRARWLGEHAPFGLRIPVSGYRQLHAEPTAIAGLPAGDRFDGAGTVLFRDVDHVRTARATPEIARDAARDEMKFIDHSRSMLAMFRLIG